MGIKPNTLEAVENGTTKTDTQEVMTSSKIDRPGMMTSVCRDSSCYRFWCLFREAEMRKLYAFYTRRTRQESPQAFLLVGLMMSLRSVIVSAAAYSNEIFPHLIISVLIALSDIILLIVFILLKSKDSVIQIVTYYGFVTIAAQLILDLVIGEFSVLVTDGLEWTLLFIYAIFALLPLFMYQCVILATVGMIIHLLTSSFTAVLARGVVALTMPGLNISVTMVAAQILLYIAAYALGIVTHRLLDRGVKESFLESKESLAVSFEIEESSKEQERLLLSVLPRHVAEEMLKDMGDETDTVGFRKIYMNRHKNVSILFADIVGFTALSSIVTPAELVRILNDLFATFDKLSQRYKQLRIKILGDCYYCICGCPKARADHAVLCIHMGLAMVETIRMLREKTKSGVDMRVGIHSGPVQGGVLGQVRWQYDVFGREVSMANKMESGGIPGRVHISQTTADCLNNEFHLEPGEGDTREDDIKSAGLKTYLIKSVNKPYPSGCLKDCHSASSVEADEESVQQSRNEKKMSVELNYNKLYKALMEREEKTRMSQKLSPLTLHFKDSATEVNYYSAARRVNGWWSNVAIVIVMWLCLIALLIVNGLKPNVIILGSMLGGSVLLTALAVVAGVAATSKKSSLSRFGMHITSSRLGQILWTVLCSAILLAASFLAALGCSTLTGVDSYLAATGNNSVPIIYATLDTVGCLNPKYFTSVYILVLLAVTSLLDVEFVVKSVICVVIAGSYCVLQWMLVTPFLDAHDTLVFGILKFELASKHKSGISVILVSAACILINRHLGRLSRKLFLYKQEINNLQKQVEDLKSKNEALIYNILPAHVVKDFIGVTRSDEELYSHAYDEVGVMFASCPNFNDFYSEDAVNNDGLECIRVLNEILSDYDDLLKEPRFRNITKIKTIGPTYMAASGMSMVEGNDKTQNRDSHRRWQHLADLVDFILAMNETLERINEQSFNNFMLRVGLNHGGILAGVIGANKPHYDIWGNTVNVASRMDSTGQYGKIQVVESTMEILKPFGFRFEQRGLIKVKGKGDLMTYFLVGKEEVTSPNVSETKTQVMSLPNMVDS